MKSCGKTLSTTSKSLHIAVVIATLFSRTCSFGETARGQCLAVGQCYNEGDSSFPLDHVDIPEVRVPVIDVAALMTPQVHSTVQWNKTAAAVARACEDWGFFQAVNHGIPDVLLEKLISQGRELFALTKEVKGAFKRTKSNARGWYDDELTKQTRDWKEGFDVGHVPFPDLPPDHPSNVVAEGYNQWPKGMPDFKETVETFYSGASRVAGNILEGVASHLGLPREFFAPSFDPHTSFLRLNYYPPCPEPCGMLSVNRHSDAGALTVLLQESGTTALQVNYRGTGQWVSIPPVDGAVTINVGDMLQVWTNDLFIAPEHRVLSQTDRDRFSAPFFYNPAYDADVSPFRANTGANEALTDEGSLLGESLTTKTAVRYKPINWGEFRLKRFAGDYADEGLEDVQISHYRLE